MQNKKCLSIRHGLANLLLLLLSCLFSVLLLEQGFRCWLFGWQAFSYDAVRLNAPVNNSDLMRRSPYDDLYWALKPGLNLRFKLARLTTNSQGLAEDREYALQKAPGTYRIAVLGDSYSMASGVDTDKSYHALIEQWLKRDYPGKHYEIINFAVGGFGLERYNATLAHLVPAWQPDALLLGYCGHNDHIALPLATGTVPPFNPPPADGFFTSYVLDYLQQWQSDRAARAADTPRAWQSPVELNEENLRFIDQQLAIMRQQADNLHAGMPVVLAYLDNRTHRPQDIEALRRIAGRHQIDFVDTTGQFAGRKLDDYSIHLLDSHPNAAANVLFANTIYQAIQQHGWFASGKENTTP